MIAEIDKWLLIGLSYQDKPLLPGNHVCQLGPVKLADHRAGFRSAPSIGAALPHGMRCRVCSSTSACFQQDGAESLGCLPVAASLSKPVSVQPAGKACPPLPALRKAAPGEWPGMSRWERAGTAAQSARARPPLHPSSPCARGIKVLLTPS